MFHWNIIIVIMIEFSNQFLHRWLILTSQTFDVTKV